MSILESMVEHEVKVYKNKLIKENILPWLLNFKIGPVNVKRFDGSTISLNGTYIEFSGSSSQIFWHGYIEPFLDDFTVKIIQSVEKECLTNKLNLKVELKYLSMALLRMYNEIYAEMADVDQKLRGKGYPKEGLLHLESKGIGNLTII